MFLKCLKPLSRRWPLPILLSAATASPYNYFHLFNSFIYYYFNFLNACIGTHCIYYNYIMKPTINWLETLRYKQLCIYYFHFWNVSLKKCLIPLSHRRPLPILLSVAIASDTNSNIYCRKYIKNFFSKYIFTCIYTYITINEKTTENLLNEKTSR